MKDRANVRLHLVGHADDQPLSRRSPESTGTTRASRASAPAWWRSSSRRRSACRPRRSPTKGRRTPAGRLERHRGGPRAEPPHGGRGLVRRDRRASSRSSRCVVAGEHQAREGLPHRDGVQDQLQGRPRAAHAREEPDRAAPLTATRRSRAAGVSSRVRRRCATSATSATSRSSSSATPTTSPLDGRDERIYADHVGISKARARRVALALQDALELPTAAIDSDGRGATPARSRRTTRRGRALNRRVEVEFWYDDALKELPDEPQMCPSGRRRDRHAGLRSAKSAIAPVVDENGKPVVPPGYADALRRAMAEIQDKTQRAPALRRLHPQRAPRPAHRAGLRRRHRPVGGARPPRDGDGRGGSSRSRPRRPSTRAAATCTRTTSCNAGFIQGETSHVRGPGGLRRARGARRLRGRRHHAAHARARAEEPVGAEPDAHHGRRRADRRPGQELRRRPALHRRGARAGRTSSSGSTTSSPSRGSA